MVFHSGKLAFTPEERAARRKLILSDALSLAMIVVITLLLAAAAHIIYHSFSAHRAALARRWDARGVQALDQHKPLAAINSLRSALALNPENTQVEIELAEALAAAGKTEQAVSYFRTLGESRPGDGLINLHLARLSAKQGHEQEALRYYQRAIFGDWKGDGYLRRREVRLEMVDYLISHDLYLRARSELLLSAGNAPQGDTAFLLRVAATMERARDAQDALHLYRQALHEKPHSVQAMEGAGRSAFALKRYREAEGYLAQALRFSSPENGEAQENTQDLLAKTQRILVLDPYGHATLRNRALRVLDNRKIAEARLTRCVKQMKSRETAAPAPETAGSQARPSLLRHPIQNLESHFNGARTAEAASEPPAHESLLNLQAQWKQQPRRITLWRLEHDENLLQSQIGLVFDTEKITAKLCGPPTGDDALLLEIGPPPGDQDD